MFILIALRWFDCICFSTWFSYKFFKKIVSGQWCHKVEFFSYNLRLLICPNDSLSENTAISNKLIFYIIFNKCALNTPCVKKVLRWTVLLLSLILKCKAHFLFSALSFFCYTCHLTRCFAYFFAIECFYSIVLLTKVHVIVRFQLCTPYFEHSHTIGPLETSLEMKSVWVIYF